MLLLGKCEGRRGRGIGEDEWSEREQEIGWRRTQGEGEVTTQPRCPQGTYKAGGSFIETCLLMYLCVCLRVCLRVRACVCVDVIWEGVSLTILWPIFPQVCIFFSFFSSGFSHRLGSPKRFGFLFHFVLSVASSAFNSTLSISLLYKSFHLVSSLPLHLFRGQVRRSTILLSTLLTCLYHFQPFLCDLLCHRYHNYWSSHMFVYDLCTSIGASFPLISTLRV